MIIKPAYGLNYKTKEACLLAWLGGKDFKLVNGPYCSIRDIEYMKADFDTIEIYWYNATKKKYSTIQIWRSPMAEIVNTTEI